jgi:hypothetical protein
MQSRYCDHSLKRTARFRQGIVAGFLLLAVLAGAHSAAVAEAWRNARVVLKSGWEHFNITVERVPAESAVLMINEDGARKKVPYSDIRSIFDMQGNDITALVLAEARTAPPRALEAQAKSGNREGAGSERENSDRRIKWMVSGGAGYGTSMGNWFDIMTSGVLVGGTIRARITDKTYLGISFQNQWLDLEEAVKTRCEEYHRPGYCVPSEGDIRMEESFILWGFMSNSAMRGAPFLFAEMGLGIVRHSMSVIEFDGFKVSKAEDNGGVFAGTLNCGAIMPFSSRVGFTAECTMRMTSGAEPPFQMHGSNMGGLLGFKMGLVGMF